MADINTITLTAKGWAALITIVFGIYGLIIFVTRLVEAIFITIIYLIKKKK